MSNAKVIPITPVVDIDAVVTRCLAAGWTRADFLKLAVTAMDHAGCSNHQLALVESLVFEDAKEEG